MNNKMPKKPVTEKEQINLLWDVVANHVLSRLHLVDLKLNFMFAFMALILALLGIVIARS